MRDAPDMPELEHHAAAGDMDRAGHALPAFDLLGAVDAGRRDIALAFRSDLRRFRDDEACACALGVIERVERVRHVAGPARLRVKGAMTMRLGTERPDLDGREEVGAVLAGRSCMGVPERRGGRGFAAILPEAKRLCPCGRIRGNRSKGRIA